MAHVAFMVAANRKRVLIMDWDLEAPGLAYYFRGLLDPAVVRKVRNSPGVLDLLWKWSGTVKNATRADELKTLKAEFESGTPFKECIQSLVQCAISDQFIGPSQHNIVLDFIGAGKSSIHTPLPIPYEDALASFSWTNFFDAQSGGYALEQLRKWACENYDYIFIDSRTGLADVAGVCTLQLPDTVVLCFVLNRQNIEGVSKVASAIKEKRGDDIAIRVVPMRVKPREAQEESDGRARAIYDLTKIGKLDNASVQNDIKTLAVSTSENVPFFENLSVFDSTNPRYDPLTLQYAKLAAELTGLDIEVPIFPSEFIEEVNRRMQPKNSTIDYLSKLKTAEPTRIAAELKRLLESAFDAEVDGTLSDDYIIALVDTTLEASENYDDFREAAAQQIRCVELVRTLAITEPELWTQFLINTIIRVREEGYIDEEFDAQLFLELDILLAATPTFDNSIMRVRMHHSEARRCLAFRNTSEAQHHSDTARKVIDTLSDLKEISAEENSELITVIVDDKITTGDINHRNQDYVGSLRQYSEALNILSKNIKSETNNKAIDQAYGLLHYRMACFTGELLDPEVGAMHAVKAVKSDMFETGAIDLVSLINPIVRLSGNRSDMLKEFLHFSLEKGRARRFLGVHTRTTKSGIRFIKAFKDLANSANEIKEEDIGKYSIGKIAELINIYLQQLYRRSESNRKVVYEGTASEIFDFINMITDSGIDIQSFPVLASFQKSLSEQGRSSTGSIGDFT